jgi:hypothetical protein
LRLGTAGFALNPPQWAARWTCTRRQHTRVQRIHARAACCDRSPVALGANAACALLMHCWRTAPANTSKHMLVRLVPQLWRTHARGLHCCWWLSHSHVRSLTLCHNVLRSLLSWLCCLSRSQVPAASQWQQRLCLPGTGLQCIQGSSKKHAIVHTPPACQVY